MHIIWKSIDGLLEIVIFLLNEVDVLECVVQPKILCEAN